MLSTLPNLIRCTICNQEKTQTSFYKRRRDKQIRRQCKKCVRARNLHPDRIEYQKAYRATNREKLKQQGQVYRQTIRSWATRVYKHSLKRAEDKGIPFDLTVEWIESNCPKYCPVLGKLLLPSSGNLDNSPSLDRIDNSKGYTQDNVVIISWRANKIKTDATAQELEAVLQYVKSHQLITD